MSLFWMQYDEPSTQRPFAPQRPEQHCALDVHVLLAVTQVGLGAMGWQVPLLQLPVQQSVPRAGHEAPRVKHWTALHTPATQAPLQQSVLPTQAALGGEQALIDETHLPPTVSQTPEQQVAPKVHAPP
jgi:hypothetical protein